MRRDYSKIEKFQIRLTATILFKDWHGTFVDVLSPGDVIESTHEGKHGFITAWGEISHKEAVRLT